VEEPGQASFQPPPSDDPWGPPRRYDGDSSPEVVAILIDDLFADSYTMRRDAANELHKLAQVPGKLHDGQILHAMRILERHGCKDEVDTVRRASDRCLFALEYLLRRKR
jgi:hypothetical protein